MKSTFNCFRYSAAFLLIVTAAAKLISSGTGEKILGVDDPLFQFPFQYMLWAGSFLELTVALICLSNLPMRLQASVVALLATNFLMYRFGLWLLGYHKPCSCMGTLTDGLHFSPQQADTIMKIVLAYLLVGSYAALYWLNRRDKNAASGPALQQTPA